MTPNKTEQEKLGCKSSEFCDKHRFLAEAEHIRYAEQLLKLNKLLLGSVSIAKRFRGTERGDWRRGKHTLQLATKDSFVPGEFSLIVLGHYVQEKGAHGRGRHLSNVNVFLPVQANGGRWEQTCA